MHIARKLLTFADMATVVKYISELLHHHDCVIVPGLGGFVANHKPATVLEEKNMFLPPVKEIGFNRSLSHHDGLLGNYIARCEGTSYQSAMLVVEAFVENVRLEIANGRMFDLDTIGTLRGDAIGNLQFSPAAGSSFLPDALGLTAFRFEPLDYKHTVKIEHEIHVPRLLKSRSPKYWGAVAALMAGLFFLSTFELKMPATSQAGLPGIMSHQASVYAIHNVAANETEVDEITTDLAVQNIETSAETKVENHKTNDFTPEFHPEQTKKFHLIAASFNKAEPALKAVEDFKAEGYSEASMIDDGKGRFRIALHSFNDRSEALDSLEKFRQQPRFSTVWVFTLK